MGNYTPNRADFVASNEKAKSQTVSQFVRITRKAANSTTPTFSTSASRRRRAWAQNAQEGTQTAAAAERGGAPALLPNDPGLRRRAARGHAEIPVLHRRAGERAGGHPGFKNINIKQCKVFIGQGKGAKNRYILFPSSFRLVLKSPCSDPHDIEHMVEVSAQSVYEAVAQTLRVFRDQEWCEDLRNSVASVLARIRQPEVEHRVCIRDFERWLETAGRSPAEMA